MADKVTEVKFSRGDRLVLIFLGPETGRAPVVYWDAAGDDGFGRGRHRVVRVTGQAHGTDHAPTHFRRVGVREVALRRPTTTETADPGFVRLWEGIEQNRFKKDAA